MKKKKEAALRLLIYFSALVVLAAGITLNVKTGLGVSPIISVAHVFSLILSCPVGDTTFVLYSVFVIAEMAVHSAAGMKREGKIPGPLLVKDLLQLPLSLVFTRIMNVFDAVIPQLDALPEISFFSSAAGRFSVLAAAIVLTGIGAAASLDMRLVPNPGDGIVQTLADAAEKETGLMKNIFDGINVLLTVIISLAVLHAVPSVGAGTVIAFLGVGRVIFLFNRLFLTRLRKIAGLEETY